MPQLHVRPALLALTLPLALAIAACSGNPKPRLLGDDYAALGPRLAIVDSQRPPRDLTVTLAQPAYVAALFVVPGRGALLVFPGDSTTSNQLSAGTHVLRAVWPGTLLADTARARVLAEQPDPRGRDSALTARRPAGTRPAPGRSAQLPRGLISAGYLLLVATPSRLDWAAVRARVEGVTIPIVDEEALNAVAKAVRSAAGPNAPWAAFAVEAQVR